MSGALAWLRRTDSERLGHEWGTRLDPLSVAGGRGATRYLRVMPSETEQRQHIDGGRQVVGLEQHRRRLRPRGPVLRPCLVCGRPAQGSRCPEHAPPIAKRNQKLRQQVAASALLCWRCGKPVTAADPLTADHVLPQLYGGQDEPGNLRACHRSCNSRAGQRLGEGAPIDRRARAGDFTPPSQRMKKSLGCFCER
jgi:5-methylcytosine-specific restriction endonuclease McrA